MYVPYIAYAGIGNDDTPESVLKQMTTLATRLESEGWVVRCDGGKGPSEVFEKMSSHELYLPWKNFNGKESQFNKVTDEAKNLTKQFHPSFESLKDSVKVIVARHAQVILGKDLKSPVKFVVCYSSDGAESGKERSAKTGYMSIPIAIAAAQRIPIFNLKNEGAMSRLEAFLEV